MAREYIPKYIQREAWKRITSVIRDYKHLKSEYEASLRNSNVYTNEIKRKIEAFETAYENADRETREIVEQRFWKHKTYRDIILPLSETTMKRYIRKFVIDVGQNLGEIK